MMYVVLTIIVASAEVCATLISKHAIVEKNAEGSDLLSSVPLSIKSQCFAYCNLVTHCRVWKFNITFQECALYKNYVYNAGNNYVYKIVEDCPLGWMAFQNSCYYLLPEGEYAIDTAQNECSLHSSRVLEIETEEENTFLLTSLDFTGDRWYWIGISDRATEGIFTSLTTGHKIQFQAWGDNEPNNAPATQYGEDYAALASNGWIDKDSLAWVRLTNTFMRVLCELPMY